MVLNNSVLEEEYTILDELDELYDITAENIEEDYSNGILSEDEYAEALYNLEQEYAATRLEIAGEALGIETEEDEEDDEEDEDLDDEDLETASYSYGGNYANFSSVSFADVLIDSIDNAVAEGAYEDAEEALVTIADLSGNELEDILALLNGEYAPTDELIDVIGAALDSPEDEFEALAITGAYAQEAALELMDEEEDVIVGEDDEEAEYSEGEVALALFAEREAVETELSNLERLADQGNDEGWLSPHLRNLILGDFSRESEQIAAFSETCEANGVDYDTHLYAMRYALDVLSKAGPLASFGSAIEYDPIVVEENAEIERQARLNLKLMKEGK